MTLRSMLLLLATLAAQGLRASTIVDVSGQVSLSLRTGDTLAFEIRSGSFEKNALAFGLPIYPTEISFALVSGTLQSGSFSASLGSPDRGVSVNFAGPLEFHDGSLSAGGLRGAVSTLQGYLELSPELSQEIFDGGTAVLRLHNNGPDVTIGLDTYTLRQDLFVSLAGASMTVGGIVDSAILEAPASGRMAPSGPLQANGVAGTLDSPSVAPEPGSTALFVAGGIVLCTLSAAMARVPKGRK
jgi:hypothetical protein